MTPASDARARIAARVRDELARAQPEDILALGQDVARRYGPRVLAVVFYGSCLRARTTDGLVDLYVMVEGYPVMSMSAMGAAVARLLPPTVYHHVFSVDGRLLHAKIAVISTDQMRDRVAPDGLDATIWARLCQPVALIYARDAEAAETLAALVERAVTVASWWAARLGPESGEPRDFWLDLFRATYRGELRVEDGDRVLHIYDAAPERYVALLSDGWEALGFPGIRGRAANPLPPESRRAARRHWRRRRWQGRALNAFRLVKAAFTYDGGVDYIAWKIERHSRQRLTLTGLQRKHPLLAAPSIVWQVIHRRVLR